MTLTQQCCAQAQQSAQIAHMIQLEQWMMEGAYNKVLDAVNSPSDEYYKTYLSQLQDTVRCVLGCFWQQTLSCYCSAAFYCCRQEVADCSESAYSTLSVSDAKKLMMYDTEPDLLEHASQVPLLVQLVLLAQSRAKLTADPCAYEQANWKVADKAITFRRTQDDAGAEDDPVTLIKYVLTYARELERIV